MALPKKIFNCFAKQIIDPAICGIFYLGVLRYSHLFLLTCGFGGRNLFKRYHKPVSCALTRPGVKVRYLFTLQFPVERVRFGILGYTF